MVTGGGECCTPVAANHHHEPSNTSSYWHPNSISPDATTGRGRKRDAAWEGSVDTKERRQTNRPKKVKPSNDVDHHGLNKLGNSADSDLSGDKFRFFCPFFLVDMLEHHRCANATFVVYSHLTQHFHREHTVEENDSNRYCPVCWSEFSSSDRRDIHCRKAECTRKTRPYLYKHELEKIRTPPKLKKRLPQGSGPANWTWLWQTWFRDEPDLLFKHKHSSLLACVFHLWSKKKEEAVTVSLNLDPSKIAAVFETSSAQAPKFGKIDGAPSHASTAIDDNSGGAALYESDTEGDLSSLMIDQYDCAPPCPGRTGTIDHICVHGPECSNAFGSSCSCMNFMCHCYRCNPYVIVPSNDSEVVLEETGPGNLPMHGK